jgi:hypothetical protein
MSRRTSVATRKQRRHPDKHVQIGQLIDRLTAYALGQRNMDESQVQSALTLLNKLLPDLRVMQLITDGSNSTLAITESD